MQSNQMAGAFSIEFLWVKNCPFTKLKKWILILLEILRDGAPLKRWMK
jgi:hypothetical protein